MKFQYLVTLTIAGLMAYLSQFFGEVSLTCFKYCNTVHKDALSNLGWFLIVMAMLLGLLSVVSLFADQTDINETEDEDVNFPDN